jgi:hypothetical protein
MRIFMGGGAIILRSARRGKVGVSTAGVTGHSDYRESRSNTRRATDKMHVMRKLLPFLAAAALLFPFACKDAEKSGTTGSSQQVEYACKCGKTKTAPEGQAPS